MGGLDVNDHIEMPPVNLETMGRVTTTHRLEGMDDLIKQMKDLTESIAILNKHLKKKEVHHILRDDGGWEY